MDSDKDFLRQFNDGEEKAIQAVFDNYYLPLCRYASGIIHHRHAAEEIVEDIFIHLWAHAGANTISTSIRNYLYRSTHNNCIKYLNKLRAEQQKFPYQDYSLDELELLLPLEIGDTESNLIVREMEERASRVIENFPPQCKQIYLLNREYNYSYSEIANQLDISVGTVKTQMSRAFHKLKEEMQGFMFFTF